MSQHTRGPNKHLSNPLIQVFALVLVMHQRLLLYNTNRGLISPTKKQDQFSTWVGLYSFINANHGLQSLTLRFCPSKGKDPLTRVYKMTPRLQMSTSGPSYFFPWKSSGAAYGGEPQKVSSLLPAENSLLKPKSAILMLESASKSRFSAWKNTWQEQRGEINHV